MSLYWLLPVPVTSRSAVLVYLSASVVPATLIVLAPSMNPEPVSVNGAS